MFWRKKYNYCSYYIVLNGKQDVEILGLEGIGLKKVNYDIVKKHRGLKYWIVSDEKGKVDSEDALRLMSKIVRIDIMNMIFGKDLKGVREIKV